MLNPTRPLVVFCSTCKGRSQHVKQTLHKNLADNPGNNCKFIIVDYNSEDDLKEYILTNYKEDLVDGKLVVYSYPAAEKFQMAHAKNMAHRCGILEGADILVNLDADNYTGEDFSEYIVDTFKQAADENGDILLWSRMIKEGPDRTTRGINGRIAVTSTAFTLVGGYDEQFCTWSPDDKDFHLRLRRLGYEDVEIPRKFLNAVPHNDKMRFKEYRHVSTMVESGQEQNETVDSSDKTVVNYGNIGCGIVYKNYDYANPIEIKPIPTRIFGIGMHKTGTTSLHHALNTLGHKSGHWKSAHWAKAIYEEMIASGRSHTLEKYYALCDLPITLLFKELDCAYPNSKFILTLRDEDAWLKSVENHWSHEANKFRAAWNTDPFTHKVHKLLYGQKGFDSSIMLTRYRRHNQEVIHYFKDRPQDLLIMDIASGWNDLCPFLDCAIPKDHFPYFNKTG